MTTTSEAVQAIATFYADLEKAQRKAITKARALRDKYQAIHDNGDAGAMATMAAFANLDALVTSQYSETLALHRDQTLEAQSLDIDVGPLPDVSPGEGGVSPRSGGDR